MSDHTWVVLEDDEAGDSPLYELLKLGGTNGPAYEPGTPTRETPDQAQRLATTDTGEAAEINRLRAAASPTIPDPHVDCDYTQFSHTSYGPDGERRHVFVCSHKGCANWCYREFDDPSFSDPGDGYDSAIRWHADFERGNL